MDLWRKCVRTDGRTRTRTEEGEGRRISREEPCINYVRDIFQTLDPFPSARQYSSNLYNLGPTTSPSFSVDVVHGCPKVGAALPLSLFLQLRHFHCIRHANGADIHFGKRERRGGREGISNYGLLSIHILGHSVCLPLEIPSLARADCTSAVGKMRRASAPHGRGI